MPNLCRRSGWRLGLEVRTLRNSDLLIATGNAGKLEEFRALLENFGTRLHSLRDLGLVEPEESEASFAGNALVKARAGLLASGMATLADDSGLTIDDLGGAPGLYTADWAETGQGRNFALAMRKTWGLLEAIGGLAPRRAAFRCTLALAWPDGREDIFEGRLEGQIVWPMRGSGGHGYDPIFQPEGHSVTLGEMEPAAKNAISHRADAVAKFIARCFT